MSFNFGEKLKISIFGQSHSKAIGVVIDGLPAGEKIDFNEINRFLAKRSPGKSDFSTKRKESDIPIILSGIVDEMTCGAPICAIIENNDTKSDDYKNLIDIPRPSHADFTAFMKYNGFNDLRGGGQFSGRLTAPLCFAGAICLQILKKNNIKIASHIYSILNIFDTPFNMVQIDDSLIKKLNNQTNPLNLISDEKANLMADLIKKTKLEDESVGGIIECCILNVPVGVGEPAFSGIENNISKNIFGIPAVKGIEFGAGFKVAEMTGSQNNDEFYFDEKVNLFKTKTNNNGGILGGISTGMPIIFRTAIKPTPSIGKEQESVNLKTKKQEKLNIIGRHDPCIVPRALVCVEAVAAITILDYLI